MSAHPRRGLAVALLALPTLDAPAADLPAALAGRWVVEDSACAGCDPVRGPESGALLRLSAHVIQNPFGRDCTAGIGVEILPDETLPALQARFGLPVRWLGTAAGAPPDGARPATPEALVESAPALARGVRLDCAGRSAFTLILLPAGDLLMPAEASTVLRLRRIGS